MSKSIEKEPLLFVDTTYKGCFVNEQSFFKTPTPKPKDIVADNYVHNFDQMGESSFQSLIPSNVTIREVVEEQPMIMPTPPSFDESAEFVSAYEEESCPYETVNILVDYGEHPETSSFKKEEVNPSDEEDILVEEEMSPSYEEDALVEEMVGPSYEENILVEEERDPMTESGMIYESGDMNNMIDHVDEGYEEVIDPVSVEDVEQSSPTLQLDEKQQELLMFIQDLTNRPSMMKAPIVQIVKKDGSLKSGMIGMVDDSHITIDNLMDEVETISLADIEGIRILHL